MGIFTDFLSRRAVALMGIFLVFSSVQSTYAEKFKVYTEPLAPVHFEKDGLVTGIATDVVREIFKEAGMEAEFEIYPWKRAYQNVLTNNGSFIFTLNRTEKREQIFKWVGPILAKKTYLYKLKNRDDIHLITLEDAKKYTTAVILGHSLTTQLLDLGFTEGKELITTPNKKVQIKVFLKGRSDLITGNQYTIYESLKSEGYTLDDVEPAVFVSSRGYYIGANIKTDDEVIKKLQLANEKVQESEFVKETIRKYIH